MEQIIGQYRTIRLLGHGGMASVYEAEHTMLGKKVAIKVLNQNLSSDRIIQERFRNEAKIMSSLNHPNIAQVIDFIESENQLSIIMELLEGEDLNQRIRNHGPLSADNLKQVFGQVLSAMQYAHDKGLVHRDIKPSNIFVLPDGKIKVLDFGIAKMLGQNLELSLTTQQIGTPVYMSPEQVKADKSIDHRTDIYSLGVTVYFAVTGKPPYDAATESTFNIFNKIVHEPIQIHSGYPKLDDILQKACSKDREKRFQHCKEFNDTLQKLGSSGKMREKGASVSEDKTVYGDGKKSMSKPDNTVLESKPGKVLMCDEKLKTSRKIYAKDTNIQITYKDIYDSFSNLSSKYKVYLFDKIRKTDLKKSSNNSSLYTYDSIAVFIEHADFGFLAIGIEENEWVFLLPAVSFSWSLSDEDNERFGLPGVPDEINHALSDFHVIALRKLKMKSELSLDDSDQKKENNEQLDSNERGCLTKGFIFLGTFVSLAAIIWTELPVGFFIKIILIIIAFVFSVRVASGENA